MVKETHLLTEGAISYSTTAHPLTAPPPGGLLLFNCLEGHTGSWAGETTGVQGG